MYIAVFVKIPLSHTEHTCSRVKLHFLKVGLITATTQPYLSLVSSTCAVTARAHRICTNLRKRK